MKNKRKEIENEIREIEKEIKENPFERSLYYKLYRLEDLLEALEIQENNIFKLYRH